MKHQGLATAAGLGAGLAILLVGKSAFASSNDEVAPVKPRRVRGRAVVAFTQVGVPYHSRKKGTTFRRIQISEPVDLLVAMASSAMKHHISEDAFLLGTLLASEAGSQPDVAKIAIAFAALTQAARLGVSLRTLLAPKALGGKLGGQLGGYASTARPPTKHDIEIGEGVLSGRYTNPAPGAIQWDSPRAQDILLRKKVPGYGDSADAIAHRRQVVEGKEAVYLAEVSKNELRLWRPAATTSGKEFRLWAA